MKALRLAAAAATFDVLLAPAALPLSACGWASVAVPVTGEVVLAWGEPAIDAASTVLEGHSFAIISTAEQI